jgi:hypothetical protein
LGTLSSRHKSIIKGKVVSCSTMMFGNSRSHKTYLKWN